MQKIISVMGTTASGKTDLALELAKHYLDLGWRCDIVSLDSRQVFQEIPVISGADVPADFKKIRVGNWTVWQKGQIFFWGVGVIGADGMWSLSHERKLVEYVLNAEMVTQANRLIMFVGGAFLYQKHILSSESQIDVAPDDKWRLQAKEMSVEELQKILMDLDNHKYESLNNSDKNNPRRLIRYIELARHTHQDQNELLEESALNNSAAKIDLQVILTAPLPTLKKRIAQRVANRWTVGLEEARGLLKLNKAEPELAVFSATGVQELINFHQKKMSEDQAKSHWLKRELDYAKRQLTWIKQMPQVKNFTINNPADLNKVKTFVISSLA